MNKILQRANRKATVGGAAVLISGAYLASRLLGLLRDRLLASHFGISAVTDAYAAAFRLPELLFTLLVSGAFAVAFIPVITAHWAREERDQAWEVSSVILNLLMAATLALGVVMFVFADPLTTLIAPGFDAFRHNLTVDLTRIMLITPFFFAISSVFGSIQQSFNRFFFYATASIFYNLGIIFGIVVLANHYGIYGVAIGVVVGTAVQAAVQILGLAGLGYRYRPSFNWRHKSVIKILKLMVPRSIDQGVNQLNYMVQTIIGSQLAVGALTAYYYANNLKNVPLAIFGSAIATAAFPKMAKSAAHKHREGLIEDLVLNARLILFLVVPAATVAVLMRGYIVRLLFGFGSPVTANLLGWFAGVIVFQSLFFLIARVYYALQDTKTPLYTSLVAIALNIVLSVALVVPYGVVGLAMAQSVAAVLQTLMLAVLLKRRLGTIGGLAISRSVAKMLLANAIMASVIYLMVARALPLFAADRGFAVIAPKFSLIVLAGGLAYLLPSYALGLREAKMVVGKLTAGIRRSLNLD